VVRAARVSPRRASVPKPRPWPWRTAVRAAPRTGSETLRLGVSDVAIKYLTHAEGVLYGLLSPWTATALLAGAIAFYASPRSLQIGPAVEVIALTSVAANLVAIMDGILVFDEPVGSGPLAIGARFVAVSWSSRARRSCRYSTPRSASRTPPRRWPHRCRSAGAGSSPRHKQATARLALIGFLVREPQFDAARPALRSRPVPQRLVWFSNQSPQTPCGPSEGRAQGLDGITYDCCRARHTSSGPRR